MIHATRLVLATSLLAVVNAIPAEHNAHRQRATGNPTLKSHQLKGVAIDPVLNRDGCGSVAWADRVLWVCRDTQMVAANGDIVHGVWDGSASYSNMTATGPDFIPIPAGGKVEDNAGYTDELLLYGNNNDSPFYVLSPEFCGNNSAGSCGNGTRYPRSPDSPPLVTSYDSSAGTITAYTWVKNKEHDGNTDVIPNPSTALYKVTWSAHVQGAESSVLPKTAFISPTFFQVNQFAYGAAGNLIVGDYAYLWAQSFSGATSLARVLVSNIEELSKYEYYVSGLWTSEMPASVSSTNAVINCTAGGQGTFYYSQAWSKYVWIGGEGTETNGQFFISTAPQPEGPWSDPTNFLTVPLGNYTGIPAYGFQAHPDLVVDKSSSNIYITYTKKMTTGYQTPVYLLEWNE